MTPTLGIPRQATHDRPDWYAVLGVEPSTTFAEIRAAYRRQALALAYDRLQELGDAYRTLRNPDTRRAYDDDREGRSASHVEPAREGRPASRRYAARSTQPGPPGKSRRRLGRIAVVASFAVLVLWAVLTTIAERREAAASVRSSPPGLATTPVP